MLFWPKLLITAYAITSALEPFIPFYLIFELDLNYLQVSGLIALVYILRLFSGTWTALVDNRPHYYGVTIALLTTLSSFSYISLLSLSFQQVETKTAWIWTLIITCSVLNGLFYQPLGQLIDSAIIKTLGDYRVIFYGSYVRWSKSTTIVMTGLIGWLISISDDNSLDTILVSIWIIGMSLLLVVSLVSTTVEPANSNQLDISDEQAPLLLKNALHLTADQNSLFFPAYKPYSIFGEQLSHISEEDASQLDRMFTTEESLRPVSSYDSTTPSFYSRGSDYTTQENNYFSTMSTIIPTVPANALALLPLPTPTDPLVAFFWWMRPDEESLEDELFAAGYRPPFAQNNNATNSWKTKTLTFTLFLLGISNSFLNSFLYIYMYTSLEISLPFIACLIMTHILCDMIVSYIIEKWFIHRLNLTFITTFVHIILILCSILYPSLKPDRISTYVCLFVLHALQGTAFQLIWLSGADQVNILMWSQYDRMNQRSRISALYSSIGPAIGVLLAGWLLSQNTSISLEASYHLVTKTCVALFAFSFVVSWGWTSDD